MFDDPVSSKDMHRKTYSGQQIIRLAQLCKQVIVLTHDVHFARRLWDDAKAIQPKTLQIKRKGSYSIIELLDIEYKTRGEYFKNYSILSEYLEHGAKDDDHLRTVAKCIRPLLEGNLRMRFPGEFSADEWLGNFLEKICEATSTDTLCLGCDPPDAM